MHRRSSFRRAPSLVFALALALSLIPATPAFATISRTLVMERAATWVEAIIPYSQTGWADAGGGLVDDPSLGWRRDCSGFASMCWNLPMPGASTRSLATYADKIPKEALQPGDLILKNGDHAVIFGGWADDALTEYWAYEMSSSQSTRSGDGTVRRKTPYPYWGEDYAYLPYRLKGITDSVDYTPYVSEVAGADRYATAIEASRAGWAAGSADTVIVASGENWPDALGASALAGAVGGPVLLTRAATLPPALTEEIGRLGAAEVIVIGGEDAVSPTVVGALDVLESIETTRVGGADRYGTSAAIAAEVARRTEAAGSPRSEAVFIATGQNFPDALAASPVAYAHVQPILLTDPARLGPDALSALEALGTQEAVVLGGEVAMSEQVADDLGTALGGTEHVSRIHGADRYQTAVALSRHAADACCMTYEGAGLANGTGFADALAGGVMAGRLGVPMLLTPPDRLDPAVAALLSATPDSFRYVRCLGGPAAISSLVRESVALMLHE